MSARIIQIVGLRTPDPEVREIIAKLGDSLPSPGVAQWKLRRIVGLAPEEQRTRVKV